MCLLLSFGAIEFGRYWWTQNTIERAAKKAVRAEAHLALAPGGPWTVAATCSGGCVGAPGDTVTVHISGPFEFILWPAPARALRGSSTIPISR